MKKPTLSACHYLFLREKIFSQITILPPNGVECVPLGVLLLFVILYSSTVDAKVIRVQEIVSYCGVQLHSFKEEVNVERAKLHMYKDS